MPHLDTHVSNINIKSVCVYCGSAFGNDDAYRTAARDLGQVCAWSMAAAESG